MRQLTDAVTDSYIYDAFGNLKDHLGTSDNRYLYAGEQYDPASGLYYLRARYYDPGNGRFLTHDPYIGNPEQPMTLHRYLYGNANPESYVDPSGEFSISELSETMKTIAELTSICGVDTGKLLPRYLLRNGTFSPQSFVCQGPSAEISTKLENIVISGS